MQEDILLDVAFGASTRSKVWKNKKVSWTYMVGRLKEVVKTSETFKEYISYTKTDRGKIKDVGGYFGGYLRNGRRKPENIIHKQLLTLDIDFAHLDFWSDFTLQFGNAALLHSSHSHSDKEPRFRLVMPLSRPCSPDEYAAVARQIAGALGIDLFDKTTFDSNRMMYWSSVSKDVDYYFENQEGEWVDVDEILDSYVDWTDSSAWPTASRDLDGVKKSVGKQEDPRNKKGIIGLFCRTYSIEETIEKYLQEAYVPAAEEHRYTYLKGSAAAGLITYDSLFAYSHHGTDPCSGKLCNSYDLARIHLFGHLDEQDIYKGKSKSETAMDDFARADSEVRKTIARESLESAKFDFADGIENQDAENIEWMQNLEVDNRGKYLSTAANVNLIFANDTHLKCIFKENLFDNRRYVFKSMPWRRIKMPEPVKNVDYSGVRNYIETVYQISANMKIEDSIALEFEKNSYDPVLDYLNGLDWDGVKRVDTLLIDYFGCVDSQYIREAIRKTLVGAVGRIYVPGLKFDTVLTLIGSQGVGKSQFAARLGGAWFSDTFLTVQGKEALEQIQGAWIIEMAELAGLRQAEVEAIKHFITKQEDTFRPAYARASETYRRRCIFIGTTNKKDFLRDSSGNRRFLPVDIRPKFATKNLFEEFKGVEIDQVWAEAVTLFRAGEKPYMSKEASREASILQKDHSEIDERKGLIEAYLDTLLPLDWDDWGLHKRKEFFIDDLSEIGESEKQFVCVAEVWTECLGKNREDMDRYKTRDINEILRGLENWEQHSSTKNFKHYGKQKYYSRRSPEA